MIKTRKSFIFKSQMLPIFISVHYNNCLSLTQCCLGVTTKVVNCALPKGTYSASTRIRSPIIEQFVVRLYLPFSRIQISLGASFPLGYCGYKQKKRRLLIN